MGATGFGVMPVRSALASDTVVMPTADGSNAPTASGAIQGAVAGLDPWPVLGAGSKIVGSGGDVVKYEEVTVTVDPGTVAEDAYLTVTVGACGVPRQGEGAGLGRCRGAGSVVWWFKRSR